MGTAASDVLGIRHPIVLAPFGGLSSVALVAAVSDAGGLGSYGLYGYDAARIRATIAAIREATSQPFAVNLWLPTGDEVVPGQVDTAPLRVVVRPFFDELGIPMPPDPDAFLPSFEEQIEAVLQARPPVLSVVYGVPDAGLVARVRERGIRLVGTATSVAEAAALDVAGVDAVVATGSEAAGHHASFLADPADSMVGLMALVPQVVDAVHVPVLAAGGIADRRGVAAAFALGASGVHVGTAFLRTRQSAATAYHRAAIADAADTTTRTTRAMSGRLGRGIPNRAVRTIEAGGVVLPFPAQNWLTGRFRAAAGAQGRGEFSSLWAGQAAALATRDDAADVFGELLAGVPVVP